MKKFNVGDKVIYGNDKKLIGKVVEVKFEGRCGAYLYLVQYGWKMCFRKLWTFGFNLEKID